MNDDIKISRPRLASGWLAVALSTVIGCSWAFWGIIENFHEGWYLDSLLQNLLLMLGQYLSPALVFIGLAIVSVHRPRLGAALHAGAGLFAAWWFFSLSGAPLLMITLPMFLIGALYGLGFAHPRLLADSLIIGLPVAVLFACGIAPALRVAGRIDDGDRGARFVAGNEVELVWSPAGPGWPRDGVSWNEAMGRCRHLSEDGTRLCEAPQDLWRLPTVEEAVRSMARHGKNCGGSWDSRNDKSSYRVTPDKESPLWDVHSKVIYWWTATEVDDRTAYIIVYDGKVWPRRKQIRPGYLGFRAVKGVHRD
jgi:hypothetical protein